MTKVPSGLGERQRTIRVFDGQRGELLHLTRDVRLPSPGLRSGRIRGSWRPFGEVVHNDTARVDPVHPATGLTAIVEGGHQVRAADPALDQVAL